MADDEFETSDEEDQMRTLTASTSCAGEASVPPFQLYQPPQATLNATQDTDMSLALQYAQLQQMMADH